VVLPDTKLSRENQSAIRAVIVNPRPPKITSAASRITLKELHAFR